MNEEVTTNRREAKVYILCWDSQQDSCYVRPLSAQVSEARETEHTNSL
jgi:hypothetical protein